MKYTIPLDDEQQYQQLLQLAPALGMGTAAPLVPLSEQQQRHLRIIVRGSSSKSIPGMVT
jgi:hypothetical protein